MLFRASLKSLAHPQIRFAAPPSPIRRAPASHRSVRSRQRNTMPSDDRQDIIQDWRQLMNMDAQELEDFLQTPESNSCGQKDDDGEAKGHKSGRYIVELLQKSDDDFTEEDVAHMRKVRSYCSRHLKQGNSKDPEHSKWRYSLMNWGHDPMKD